MYRHSHYHYHYHHHYYYYYYYYYYYQLHLLSVYFQDIPAETGSVNMEPPPYRYRYQNAFTETGSFHMETSPSPAHYQIVSHVWRAEKNILWTQLKLTEEGHFGFWQRKKWNESQIFPSGLWLLYLVVCSETKRERLLRRLIFMWIDSLAIINQK